MRPPATARTRSAAWVVVATTSGRPPPFAPLVSVAAARAIAAASRRATAGRMGSGHLTETDSRYHVPDGFRSRERLGRARPSRAGPRRPPRGRRARRGPAPAGPPALLPQRPGDPRPPARG